MASYLICHSKEPFLSTAILRNFPFLCHAEEPFPFSCHTEERSDEGIPARQCGKKTMSSSHSMRGSQLNLHNVIARFAVRQTRQAIYKLLLTCHYPTDFVLLTQ
jgi:hypothetical protein